MKVLHSFSAVVILFVASFASAAEPHSSHEVAARQLVEAVGGASMAEAGADAMLVTVRKNPELAPYEDVFRAWFKKVMTSGDFEGELASVYMKHFSEDEIRRLTAFYATPLGQKLVRELPEVMNESAAIGMRRGEEHSSELKEMLEAARRERARGAATEAPAHGN
jgi:hypothetical protein